MPRGWLTRDRAPRTRFAELRDWLSQVDDKCCGSNATNGRKVYKESYSTMGTFVKLGPRAPSQQSPSDLVKGGDTNALISMTLAGPRGCSRDKKRKDHESTPDIFIATQRTERNPR